ncbi:hypothetical protein [Pseudomonas fluvialis]|jgi:hypothetical protein|nr:hypothetical protein [Pseudomonas pharmacofabricae]
MQGKKPDLLWVLVILLGLGLVTTAYSQALWQPQAETVIQQP